MNASTGITTASAQITNVNVNASTIASLVNTNFNSTNMTVSNTRITSILSATGTSNTIGSIITTSGNVGIGNVTPTYTLDIIGNGLHVGDTSYGGFTLEYSGNNVSGCPDFYNLSAKPSYAAGGGSGPFIPFITLVNTYPRNRVDIVLAPSGGNVGVKNSSPAFELDVSGNIRATSNLYVGGGVLYPNTNITSGTNFAINVYGGTLSVNGPTTLSGYGINAAGTSTLGNIVSVASGNVGIGVASPSHRLEVSGNIQLSNVGHTADSGNYSMEINAPTGSGLVETSIRFHQQGRYWQQIRAYNAGFKFTQGDSGSLVNIEAGGIIGTGLTSSTALITNAVSTNITVSNLNVASFASSNINTTNITCTSLLVTNITSAGVIRFGNNATSGISFGNNLSRIYDDAHLRIYTDDNMYFYTSNTTASKMYINSTGNIGIGTETLSSIAKLHVHGQDSSLSSGSHMTFTTSTDSFPTMQMFNYSHDAASLLFDAYYDSSGVLRLSHTSGFAIYKSNNSLIIGGAVASAGASVTTVDTLSINTAGNLGMGTLTPGEKLDIRGNLRVGNSTSANYISFYGTNGDSPANWNHTYIGERIYSAGTELSELLLFKGNDAAPSGGGPDRIRLLAGELRFDTYSSTLSGSFDTVGASGTTRMTVATSGNVGIGTSSPSYTLDVTGTARVTTSITTGGLEVTGSGVVDTPNLTVTTAATINSLNVTTFNPANVSSTNITSATLNLSTGITAASAQIINARLTNATTTSLFIINGFTTASTSYFNDGITALGVSTIGSSIFANNTIITGEITTGNLHANGVLKSRGEIIVGTTGSFSLLPKIQMYSHTDSTNPILQLGAYDSSASGLGLGCYLSASGSITMSSSNTSWFIGKSSSGFYIDRCTGTTGSQATSTTAFSITNNGTVSTANSVFGNISSGSVSLGSGSMYFSNNGAGLVWGNSFSRIYDDGNLRIVTDDHMQFMNGGVETMWIDTNAPHLRHCYPAVGSNTGNVGDANRYWYTMYSNFMNAKTGQVYGFDYAEMFEWADGNLNEEDRIGMTVVFDGVSGKIRIATTQDSSNDIFGAMSATYGMLGNTQWGEWQGKYLKDDYGREIKNEQGEPILNPAFNEEQPYTDRLSRKEWDAIGLLGRLRINKNCPKNPNWVKICDVSNDVEEWYVR